MLGQCVADFGWLEEIIKRTIYALDKVHLAGDLTERQMQGWLKRMESVADDSLGTLIEQLDNAMRRHPGLRDRDEITDLLNEIKLQRNLLCHASWHPTDDPGRWLPAFVSSRGEIQTQALSVADLDAIRCATAAIGARVRRVMRATGEQGFWAGDDHA